ncbi:MAG: hypothetical protein AB7G17_09595 [Phycisphaerales bacterium]
MAGATASAGTVNLDFQGSGLNQSVRIHDTSLGVSNLNVAAGQLKYKVLAGGTHPGFTVGSIIYTFCTDISQGAADGYLTIVSLDQAPAPGAAMGLDRAAMISLLYATKYADSQTTAAKAAAFQLAVWEIVNEATIDFSQGTRGLAGLDASSGDFRASTNASAQTQANSYLDSAFTAFKDGLLGMNVVAGVSPTIQDQLFIIPLPTGAGLACAGLLTVGARRKR